MDVPAPLTTTFVPGPAEAHRGVLTKFVPVTVTVVPPAIGPAVGLTVVTDGGPNVKTSAAGGRRRSGGRGDGHVDRPSGVGR